MICFFLFMDPATTEIYTYGHTLSLHDALPIWPMAEARPGSPSNCPIASASASGSLGGTTRPLTSSATISALPPTRVAAIGSAHAQASSRARSEEHTSELQSLMRISYAVFCLKKKITTKNPTTLLHYHRQ